MTFFPSPSVQAQSQPIGTTLPQHQALQPSDNSATLCRMGDAELQRHILRCALQAVEAHRRYQRDGYFADAGDRDRYLHAHADALVEQGARE